MNIWEIFLIAIGLSMDTFSLSLAISLTNKFNNINKLSILVGLYHFVMPIIGCVIGNRLYFLIHFNYSHLLGVILILIAINIILEKNKNSIIKNSFIGLNIFAFTVSIDALSVGIGLKNIYLYYSIIFALVSFIFTYIGLKFGREINKKIKYYPEIIGIILLLIIGIYNLIK